MIYIELHYKHIFKQLIVHSNCVAYRPKPDFASFALCFFNVKVTEPCTGLVQVQAMIAM